MPSDELFSWWSDRVAATGQALYGRKLWETMSSHWPTADQQPGVTPAQIEFARRWRDMPKVVFSSTSRAVDWNARLVTGDAVAEITRLKTEDGGPMDIGGARISTDEINQPYSLEAQAIGLEAFVASQPGHTISHRFVDQASGATLDRPGLQAALTAAKSGDFDVLLVYRIDRLTRSIVGLMSIVEELEAAGVAPPSRRKSRADQADARRPRRQGRHQHRPTGTAMVPHTRLRHEPARAIAGPGLWDTGSYGPTWQVVLRCAYSNLAEVRERLARLAGACTVGADLLPE